MRFNTRVITAGMKRSGSTWLFNAVRLLANQKFGGINVYSAWYGDYRPTITNSVHVVKVHGFDRELLKPGARGSSSMVVTSSRDFRDVAASMINKRYATQKNVIGHLHRIAKEVTQWRQYSVYNVSYDQLKIVPVETICHIAEALGWDDDFDVKGIVERLNTMSFKTHNADGKNTIRRYNKENLLHRGHVTNGGIGYYKDVLSPELIASIEAQFPAFIINTDS